MRAPVEFAVGRLVNEAKETTMVYPCERCNMDEGSPVCLMDDRCTRLGPRQAPALERTVADIPDADLLRRVVRHLAHSRPRRKEFAWAAVSEAFGLGSTFSAQLCRRFGLDPDTGADLKTPNEKGNRPA